MELIKLVQKAPLRKHRNAFVNLALPFFAFIMPLHAETIEGLRGRHYTLCEAFDEAYSRNEPSDQVGDSTIGSRSSVDLIVVVEDLESGEEFELPPVRANTGRYKSLEQEGDTVKATSACTKPGQAKHARIDSKIRSSLMAMSK
jgi:hypothetical protein